MNMPFRTTVQWIGARLDRAFAGFVEECRLLYQYKVLWIIFQLNDLKTHRKIGLFILQIYWKPYFLK